MIKKIESNQKYLSRNIITLQLQSNMPHPAKHLRYLKQQSTSPFWSKAWYALSTITVNTSAEVKWKPYCLKDYPEKWDSKPICSWLEPLMLSQKEGEDSFCKRKPKWITDLGNEVLNRISTCEEQRMNNISAVFFGLPVPKIIPVYHFWHW